MNIIRKIKLNSLGYYQFTVEEQELFKFIKRNLLNLKEVQLDKYTNRKFWFKYNKLIMEYNLNHNRFGVNYNLIWLVLEDKFGYSFLESENLIIDIMKNIYKFHKITRPLFNGESKCCEIEKVYKNEYNKKN